MTLTPRQLEVLDYIVEYIHDNRYAPTLREMADEFDLSRVTVLQHVEALDEKGYLDREPNRARGIKVTERAQVPDSLETADEAMVSDRSETRSYSSTGVTTSPQSPDRPALPVVGYLSDRASVQERETPSFLPVGELLPSDNGFLVEVRSDQFSDHSILEGDMLVVDGGRSGSDGDLVLVEVDGEMRLVERTDEDPGLVPLNGDGEGSFTSDESELKTQGTVRGVIRNFHE